MSEPENSPETETDLKFRNMADRFIDTANRQLSDTAPAMVSSAFLYGASRFSAFVATHKAGTLERFDELHDEAVEYYTDEFKKMLIENLAHHRDALEKNT